MKTECFQLNDDTANTCVSSVFAKGLKCQEGKFRRRGRRRRRKGGGEEKEEVEEEEEEEEEEE